MALKRIGIMTWYTYQNYGTALQAAALTHVISKLGYDANVVAYDPEMNGSHNNLSLFSRIKNRLSGTYPIIDDVRTSTFNKFVYENIPTTKKVATEEDFNQIDEEHSAFVCGSDQIWSPRCFDSHYYLDFVADSNKKIAYAPSFGCDYISDCETREKIAKLITAYSFIAMREDSGSCIVKNLTGKSANVVLDPTLLLKPDQWEAFRRPYALSAEPYCLFYFLGADANNINTAYKIAHNHDLRVYQLPVFMRQLKLSDTLGLDVGPSEFITLIKNASLICTDSFHCMAFATLFKRPFVGFERFDPKSSDSQNTRVYSFLKSVDLMDALIPRTALETWSDFPKGPAIDSIAQQRIDVMRAASIDYLQKSLSKATNGSLNG